MKHDPNLVAHIAAGLLQGRPDAEPHHIKQAIKTAGALLDEAHAELDVAIEPEITSGPALKPEPEAAAVEADKTKA